MKSSFLNLIGISCVAATSFLPHQTYGDESVSLEQALRMALDSTPSLKSQRELIDFAKRDRTTRWLPPEPTMSYAENDNSAAQQYSLSLTVPFPLKLWAKAREDDIKVENAARELGARQQEIVRAVAQSYLGCAAAKESLALAVRVGDDLASFARFVTRQYESGFSSQSEKIGIELQLAQSKSELETAKISADANCRQWQSLTQNLFGTSLSDPSEIPTTLPSDLLDRLGSHSAERLRATATRAQADISEQHAAWMKTPDISFSVNRNHYLLPMASPSGSEWTSNYMVSISVPIFFLWNERTDVQRTRALARQEAEAAKLAQVQAENEQVEACRLSKRGSKRLEEIQNRDLPLAEAWVESSEAAYRRGRIGFSEMLLARKTISDLRVQQIQGKTNLIANLIRSLGETCD